MKCKESCIEIIFTIQTLPKKIQEFTIDRITLEKLLKFNGEQITQKDYDFLVILNDKADKYFYRNNPFSEEKNLFYGLPEIIEKHFKLPENYKVFCIEKKIENTKVELFRNTNEQNNMGSLEVENKKLQASVIRGKSICV